MTVHTDAPDTETAIDPAREKSSLRRILVPLLLAVAALLAIIPSAQALDYTAPGQVLAVRPYGLPTPVATENQLLADGGWNPVSGGDTAHGEARLSDITCTDIGNARPLSALNCLPLTRWYQSTDLSANVQFSLTNAASFIGDGLISKVTFQTFMTIGNIAWFASLLALDVSTNHRIPTTLMKPLNDFAGAFGSAMLDSGILAAAVGVALITLLWASMRRGFQLRRLVGILVSAAAVGLMITGSMQDVGEGEDYQPGTGSPAWIAQTTSQAISAVANPMARSVSQATSANSEALFTDASKRDPYSCYNYVEFLYDGYGKVPNNSAGPEIISRWWMNTAYKTYGIMQYGEGSTIGPDYALCHQLELDATSPAAHYNTMASAVTAAGGDPTWVPASTSPAMQQRASGDEKVQQLVFFGLCGNDGSHTKMRADLDEGIAGGKVGGAINTNACDLYRTRDFRENYETSTWGKLRDAVGKVVGSDGSAKEFENVDLFILGHPTVLGNPDNGLIDHPEAYEFAGNVTGADTNSMRGLVAIYALSAVIGSVGIFGLAVVLFIMKSLSYVMAFFMIFAAIANMISPGGGALGSFMRQWLGFTVATSITSLLIAFVFMLSDAIFSVGSAIFSQAAWIILWAGVSPLLAIILLNWVFKKFFKTASPLTAKGMRSFMGNPAATGALAGAGAGLVKDAVGSASRKGMKQLAGGFLDRIGGGAGKKGAPGEGGSGTGADGATVGAAKDSADSKDTQEKVDSGAAAGAAGAEGAQGASAPNVDAEAAENSDDAGSASENAPEAAGATIGGAKNGDEGVDPEGLPAAGTAAAAALAGGSLADRIGAFADHDGKRPNALGDGWNATKAGAVKLGSGAAAAAGKLRDQIAPKDKDVRGALWAHRKRALASGLSPITSRVSSAAAAAKALREHPGAAASYLTRRSATKLASLGRGAVDAVSGMDKKKLLKGAALYGGLSVATGGIGAPAALFAGKHLLKNREAILSGPGKAASALGDTARKMYGGLSPDRNSAEFQKGILEQRLNHAKVHGVDGQMGIAADGSDHLELAKDLPLAREALVGEQQQAAEREFDVFAEQHGRQMNEAEMQAVMADKPFARDVMDRGMSPAQGTLDMGLGAAAVTGHSNHAATREVDGGTRQGASVDQTVRTEGNKITERRQRLGLEQIPGDNVVMNETVQHAQNTHVKRGPDEVVTETEVLKGQVKGPDRITRQQNHEFVAGERTESRSSQPARRTDGGTKTIGLEGQNLRDAAQRAGVSPSAIAAAEEKMGATSAQDPRDAAGPNGDGPDLFAAFDTPEQAGEIGSSGTPDGK